MQFIVNNQLPFETTIHFHGIAYDTMPLKFCTLRTDNLQAIEHSMVRYEQQTPKTWTRLTTNLPDGVPGLSQKKIEPGCTFKYKWTATQYGTYWYHGHVQGQIEDGLIGAIYIKCASRVPGMIKEILIFLDQQRVLLLHSA
jgi:FtsP/CotA-like multicopper oxidase with cupredoxin domain